ncbi:MAG: glycosyl transferase, families GT8 + GT64 [Amphiamblys sp. WSBS2006]|nr:MAG: glycosyl transferase, families GT8 + GT64 [Amphiamblys sp. WSBS2006]
MKKTRVLVLSCLLALGVFLVYTKIKEHKRHKVSLERNMSMILDDECDKNIAGVLYKPLPKTKGKFAYVTLLCDDTELQQALALAQSWKDTQSKYPLIVMVLPPVGDTSGLEAIGARVRATSSITAELGQDTQQLFAKMARYSKLHVWKLTEYEKVAYVDTQMLFVANADDVFGCSGFGAVKTAGNDFNTAFFVARPDKDQHAAMLRELPKSPGSALGDQGFINWFYDTHRAYRTTQLSVVYNTRIINKNYAVWNGIKEHVRLLHFVDTFSPWNFFLSKTPKWNFNFEYSSFLLWEKTRQKAGQTAAPQTLTALNRDALCADPSRYNPKRFVVSTHFSVIIGTWGEERLPLLRQLVLHYQRCKSVHKIYVVWHNPDTKPPQTFLNTVRRMPPVEFLPQARNSLNNRFNPIFSLETKAVLICDDDIRVSPGDIEFTFNVWRNRQDSAVGSFPRADARNPDGTYSYLIVSKKTPRKYSMVLTKLMFIRSEYLYIYTCLFPSKILEYVDENKNCEDIAINMLITGMTGSAPVAVMTPSDDFGTAKGISTKHGHLAARSKCITRFAEILGQNPLQENAEVFSPLKGS